MQMMENGPDPNYDVRFFNGSKVTVTADTATAIDTLGSLFRIPRADFFNKGIKAEYDDESNNEDAVLNGLSAEVVDLLMHAHECVTECQRLEAMHGNSGCMFW